MTTCPTSTSRSSLRLFINFFCTFLIRQLSAPLFSFEYLAKTKIMITFITPHLLSRINMNSFVTSLFNTLSSTLQPVEVDNLTTQFAPEDKIVDPEDKYPEVVDSTRQRIATRLRQLTEVAKRVGQLMLNPVKNIGSTPSLKDDELSMISF